MSIRSRWCEVEDRRTSFRRLPNAIKPLAACSSLGPAAKYPATAHTRTFAPSPNIHGRPRVRLVKFASRTPAETQHASSSLRPKDGLVTLAAHGPERVSTAGGLA